MKQEKIYMYTDGGANPNPGPGGYGVILKCNGHQKDISEGYKKTTNNRMELRGVIAGLQALKNKSNIIITTDSQYTINGIEKGWAKKWKANNWYRTGKQKAQNWDLWEILLSELEGHTVKFEWIRGHTGHIENEFCDELATLAMQKNNLLIDEGYRETPPQKQTQLPTASQKTSHTTPGKKIEQVCKKCGAQLEEKKPKHTQKTLEKKYYYEYYHHCPSCKTNYMLEDAKRDIKNLKL